MNDAFALIALPDGKHFVKAIHKNKSISMTDNRFEAMRFENKEQAERFGMRHLREAFLIGVYNTAQFESTQSAQINRDQEHK